MAKEDQKWRFKIIGLMRKGNTKNISKISKKISEIDRKNTKNLKEIVYTFGWPTISLVGKKSSYLAWLLVQHSNNEIEFQKKCLELMKVALKKKEIIPKNYSYLSDRIRIQMGKPQFFGTQNPSTIFQFRLSNKDMNASMTI